MNWHQSFYGGLLFQNARRSAHHAWHLPCVKQLGPSASLLGRELRPTTPDAIDCKIKELRVTMDGLAKMASIN